MGISRWYRKEASFDNEDLNSIKHEVLKGGNEMAKKNDFDELDNDIEDLNEDEELEEIEEKPMPKKPMAKPQSQSQPKQSATRFTAIHQPQVETILDNATNKPVGDILDILSSIKNDLEEIKRAVGS